MLGIPESRRQSPEANEVLVGMGHGHYLLSAEAQRYSSLETEEPRCHHHRAATSVAPQALRPGPPRDGLGKEVHRSTSVSTMVPAGIIDAVTLKGMSECRAARMLANWPHNCGPCGTE